MGGYSLDVVEKALKFRSKIEELQKNDESTNEQNLNKHVIRPIFVDVFGYKLEWWTDEAKFENSRKAVDVRITDSKGTQLLVEVKRSKHRLVVKDIRQLTDYLNDKNEYNWGVLTNGWQWILINNNINTNMRSSLERMVFNLDLEANHKGEKNLDYLRFFTHDNLLKNKEHSITTYYKDLQQFKITYSGKSWVQYKTAVHRFFQFLIEKYERHIDLTSVRQPLLEEYFRWLSITTSKSTRSKYKVEKRLKRKTIVTQFRYIGTFFRNMYAMNNPLIEIRLEDILEEVHDIIADEDNEYEFEKDLIEQVDLLIANKREYIRDRLIFALFLIGLSRQEIASLSEKSLMGNKISLMRERQLELPTKVLEQIERYNQNKNDNKIKSTTLMCNSKGNPLTPQYVSEVINDYIKQVNPLLTIEKIQQYLFRDYILKTGDVFSVAYIADLSLGSIQDILKNDDMISMAKKGKFYYKQHTFATYLN
jgi:site-specific recombinase XerD